MEPVSTSSNPIIIAVTTTVLVVIVVAVIWTILRYWFGIPSASQLVTEVKTDATSVAQEIVSTISLEPQPEVFAIAENKYRFADAPAVCGAFGADVATLAQIKKAYDHGAEWCSYSWTASGDAVFPTQKSTWEKMQEGPPDQRNNCGLPGVNGGKFDNPELQFGVACFGTKPSQSVYDRTDSTVPIRSPETIEADKKIAEYKAKLNTISILPFSHTSWSQ